MKTIRLLSHLFIESAGNNPLDHQAAEEITKTAHENRKMVIVAGLFVEREMEAVIGFYLFPAQQPNEQFEFVRAELLGSDAFSFSQKKRLILSLINRKSWLSGDVRGSFDKEPKKVISFRNAFAHGDIIVRDSIAFVEFFERSKKKIELSDDYWSDVESTFDSLVKPIETVKAAAGMPSSGSDAA